jgi:predicted secreted protein
MLLPTRPFRFDIARADYARFYTVKAWKRLDDHRVAVMQPVQVIAAQDDACVPCPEMMNLTQDDCQSLIDALWEAGIRPTQGHGSTGQLAAVQDHLNDTRTLLTKITDALILQLPPPNKPYLNTPSELPTGRE